MLLNSEMVTGYASRLAGRLMNDVGTGDLPKLVDAAYEAAFGRAPDKEERLIAIEFIGQQQTLTGEKSPETAIAAAFGDFCHALLNSNEFLYVE